MNGINLSAKCNVAVRCFDGKKLVRTSYYHNKATISLVQGLLRFLKGDFTPSKFTLSAIHDSGGAVQYIPSVLQFGNVGVRFGTDPGDGKKPLVGIDSSEFKYPTFNEVNLQKPLVDEYYINQPKFESADITAFDDTNNSMALLLQTFVPAKSLLGYNQEGVGFTPYPWTYWNPSLKAGEGAWETIITELGLYSDSRLLARVVLDGDITIDSSTGQITYNDPDYPNNPIFQSEISSMVIEWRIGIVSIGPNDTFFTEADINE